MSEQVEDAPGVEEVELDAQEKETEEKDSEGKSSLDDVEDPEALKELVRKLRRENANARVKNKELDEFRAWKESQLSEAERLQQRLKEAEEKIQEATKKALMAEYGLDSDLSDFIFGTEDEMAARAKRLAEKVKRPAGEKFSGDRKPVASEKAGGDFLSLLAKRDLGA